MRWAQNGAVAQRGWRCAECSSTKDSIASRPIPVQPYASNRRIAGSVVTVVEEHLGPWTTRLDRAEQRQLHDLLTRLVGAEPQAGGAVG